MNKRTKTDRELLLDASLEFIMNSPEEVFDQYLKEAGEDGSELERRATDAIGAALARHESAAVSGSLAPAIQDKLEAQEAEIKRLRKLAMSTHLFEEAPCFLCGYNGPGYYQPEQHPCAALYHEAMEEQQ